MKRISLALLSEIVVYVFNFFLVKIEYSIRDNFALDNNLKNKR